MKRIISLLVISCFMSAVAYCQAPEGRGMRGDGQSLEQLNLSEEQNAKVSAINEDFRNKMKVLKDDNTLSEDQLRERRRELFNARRKKILELLTPEQRTKFEAAMPERGQRFDVEEYRTALNLTDEQYNKLKELISASRDKEMSMMNGGNMTPDQRRAYMDAMNKNNREILKTILTPEQMIKLDQMGPKKPFNAEKVNAAGKD
jgi:Spy/CpxP family protein refolding chaperone